MAATNDITIRPATSADIAAASALLVRAWHATYDGIYGAAKVDEITARWHAPEMLARQLTQSEAAFLIAERDGKMIATSYARMLADGIVSLDRIYVDPEALGAGIGKQLMAATLDAFPDTKCVRLEVAPENARAIAFYQRQGFTKVGAVTSCESDSGVAADVYEKLLGRM